MEASAVYIRVRRRNGREGRLRSALEDSMPAMLAAPTVRAVRRTLDVCQGYLRNP